MMDLDGKNKKWTDWKKAVTLCEVLILLAIILVVCLIVKNRLGRGKESDKVVATAERADANASDRKASEDNAEAAGKLTPTPSPTVSVTPVPPEKHKPEKGFSFGTDYEVHTFTKTDNTISIPADEDPAKYDDMIELTPLPGAAKPYLEGDNPQENRFLTSSYMVLVNLEDNTIVAERDSEAKMNPASMTKVMTVLTAMDYLSAVDLDKKAKISQYAVDYAEINDCSAVCYHEGMEVPVRELFYGTIVCSGADAAIALAEYVAGSDTAFVELMNAKAEQLGISETTHFANVVGMYDENNYSRVQDIAVILDCAMQNSFLATVLGTRRYPSSLHKDDGGLVSIDSSFLLRIEDRETNGNIIAQKTGYLVKAGNCAVSMLETPKGRRYICVTGNTDGSWRCICDHVSVYRSFTE